MFIHLLFNISLICTISFFLLMWFDSDIIQTIGKLTNTRNLLKLPEFEKYKLEEDLMSNYANFLFAKYPGYLTKLFSCPICLCFWSTLLSIGGSILHIGYPYEYLLILLPINYISSLLIYLILRKLL